MIVRGRGHLAELVEALLTADERVEVSGRAHNGKEGVTLVRRLAPDVIVMDIGTPLKDGIEATRRIRRGKPAVGVVIFTGSDEARDLERAREVGAAAYVQKSLIDAVLLTAIHRAAAQRQTPVRDPDEEHTLEATIPLSRAHA